MRGYIYGTYMRHEFFFDEGADNYTLADALWGDEKQLRE
jgi:hypothetical protein